MAEKPSINFVNINYDDIKADLKAFIGSTSEFNTHNFDASNITLVTNLLSYITTLLNFYINQAVNENYIDSARLRKNLLSIIKLLNYTPSRTTSAYVYMDITVTPTVGGSDVIIPRYSLFTAGEYNYYNTEELVFENANGYLLENVKLTEGTITQLTFTGDGEEYQEFLVEDTIMGDYLRVWGYELDVDGNETSTEIDWEIYTEILALPNPINAKIFFLEEIETGYKIVTGNGSFGMKPISGHSLNIDYLQSSGASGNELILSEFDFSDAGTNLDTISLAFSTETGYITTQSFGGVAKETMASIKFNAPKFYSTQGRAVTDDDYLAITLKRADVAKASVVGGEDVTPIALGTVYIYAKPTVGIEFNATELNTIRSYLLDYSVLTINPIVANAEYIHLDITSIIRYTSSNPGSTSIIDAMNTYINETIQEFGTYFKYSEMIATIDGANSLISSNLTTLKKYRLITDDDEDGTSSEYAFYLTKNLATGTTFYIEKWTTGTGASLQETINEGDLTSVVKNTTTGYITFEYSSFDFVTYEYRCYFNTLTDDIFTNFQQLLYLDTDEMLSLTFESIDV